MISNLQWTSINFDYSQTIQEFLFLTKKLDVLINNSKQLLKHLYNWFQDNRLTLNHKKSYFSIFHNKNKPMPDDLTSIEIPEIGVKISRSSSVKYIGLILDEKLDFKEHTASVIKSVTKFFGMFKKIKDHISFKLARQLYFAFIYSRLKYGIEIYGNCAKTLMKKLQIVQNKLLKFLFKKGPLTGTDELHHEIRILQLKDLFEFSLAKLVHDCLNDNCPPSFSNYFQFRPPSLLSRVMDTLTIPKSKKGVGQSRVECKGAKIWNKTDKSITSLPNRNSFKKTLMDSILAKYNT